MTLHLPIAVPGSGKSTLAKQLIDGGDITRDSIVSPDGFRELLTGDRSNQRINKEVFDIVDKVVASRLREGLDVFLDATNLTKDSRAKPVLLADHYDQPIIIYMWDQPRWLTIQRNEQRTHAVPSHVMDKMFYRLYQVNLAVEFPEIKYALEWVYHDPLHSRSKMDSRYRYSQQCKR